jgi:hypothetical protein
MPAYVSSNIEYNIIRLKSALLNRRNNRTRYHLHVFVRPAPIITLETSDGAKQSRNICSPGSNHSRRNVRKLKKDIIN